MSLISLKHFLKVLLNFFIKFDNHELGKNYIVQKMVYERITFSRWKYILFGVVLCCRFCKNQIKVYVFAITFFLTIIIQNLI